MPAIRLPMSRPLPFQEFQGEIYRLADLFVEEQRRIVGIVLKDRFTDYQQSFERLADPDDDLLFQLRSAALSDPEGSARRGTVRFDHLILQEIARLERRALKHITHLAERGRMWSYQPDRELLGQPWRAS